MVDMIHMDKEQILVEVHMDHEMDLEEGMDMEDMHKGLDIHMEVQNHDCP